VECEVLLSCVNEWRNKVPKFAFRFLEARDFAEAVKVDPVENELS
jgi:hypothetical protein